MLHDFLLVLLGLTLGTGIGFIISGLMIANSRADAMAAPHGDLPHLPGGDR